MKKICSRYASKMFHICFTYFQIFSDFTDVYFFSNVFSHVFHVCQFFPFFSFSDVFRFSDSDIFQIFPNFFFFRFVFRIVLCVFSFFNFSDFEIDLFSKF